MQNYVSTHYNNMRITCCTDGNSCLEYKTGGNNSTSVDSVMESVTGVSQG